MAVGLSVIVRFIQDVRGFFELGREGAHLAMIIQ
jgi:hypothetical protein